MASIFWDAHEVIFIEYLEKERTITRAYYAVLLDQLIDQIRKKLPNLKEKKILFHDEDALSHTSNIAQAKKHGLSFESLPHPPYSPDLAPATIICSQTSRDGCVENVLTQAEIMTLCRL